MSESKYQQFIINIFIYSCLITNSFLMYIIHLVVIVENQIVIFHLFLFLLVHNKFTWYIMLCNQQMPKCKSKTKTNPNNVGYSTVLYHLGSAKTMGKLAT